MTAGQRQEAEELIDDMLASKGLTEKAFNSKRAYEDFAIYHDTIEALALLLDTLRKESDSGK